MSQLPLVAMFKMVLEEKPAWAGKMRISELAFSHSFRSLGGGQEGSLLIALESSLSSLLVENFVSAACCSFMVPRKDGSYRFSFEP